MKRVRDESGEFGVAWQNDTILSPPPARTHWVDALASGQG